MKTKRQSLEKADPSAQSKAVEIESYIKSKLKRERYEHVLSVRDTAIDLAIKYNANSQQVNLSALLHDCAKWMSPSELYEAAANYGIQLDEIEHQNASLLHAIIGVELAVSLFDVNDSDILSAIRAHTTGKGTMMLIDKILYVSDFAEPKRTHNGAGLVRELAYQDLNQAVFEVSRYKIEHLLIKRAPIHPNTIDAYNKALREISKRSKSVR